MSGNRREPHTLPFVRSCDWGRLFGRRFAEILRTARRCGALTPREILALATREVPAPCAAALRELVRRRGWLRPGARLPFDICERDRELRSVHPAQRPWVRLALFGLPGEGLTSDTKHRQALYDRCCATIRRETTDLPSLQAAGARVLSNAEVRADASLFGMLQSFIGQREAELRQQTERRARDWQVRSGARPAEVREPRVEDKEAQRKRVEKAATRIMLRLEESLAHYDMSGARRAVDELKRLRRLHPEFVQPGDVYGSEARVAQLADRLPEFRHQLEKLAREGALAASSGDPTRAQWIARRLTALHQMLPEVLPDDEFERMRARVLRGVQDFEQRQVQQEIITEERAVAAEIKHLAGIVHRFYKVEKRLEPDSPVYRQAEQAYREAVREVFDHDRNWLASLMMKLDALLEDLDDPEGQAGAQVDTFLEKVRVALVRLRKEIQSHDQ